MATHASSQRPLRIGDPPSASPFDEWPVMWRNLRLQPKTAFTRFPPVHAADPEGRQRVEIPRSPSR
jgi:hypothetical protein